MTRKPDPHTVDRHVGARLRLGRRFHKLSQDALGQVVGVTFQQVQKYESGTNRISASVLFAFARRLERPIDWFFEGLEPLVAGAVMPVGVQALMALDEAPELLVGLAGLPEVVRRQLIALIREAAISADAEAPRGLRPLT